jgi:GntP family gluconate:H+ symporter
MLGGMAVSAVAATVGYAYAAWANQRWDIPLRASATPGLDVHAPPRPGDSGPSLDAERAPDAEPAPDAEQALAAEAGAKAAQDSAADAAPGGLPPLWLALTPILLPVILISLSAVLGTPAADAGRARWLTALLEAVHTLGEKNLSMTLAAAVGLTMVVARRRTSGATLGSLRSLSTSVGEALSSAGVIILITAAGGAFGYVLRQTDIAASLTDLVPTSRLALIPLAFAFTTLIRVAQGSATVAMIAAAGIISPLAAGGAAALGYHPVYLALAIGCGSKPVMWMNDSGFWIIGKMSGFTEAETLKTATVMMALMGLAGLAAVMAGAWLLPLAG